MDNEPLILQPFVIRDGQMLLGPELPTQIHENIGFVIDKENRSLIITLYDQAMMDPDRGNQTVPAVMLPEKTVAQMIFGLQEALQHLQGLPVNEKI